MSLIYLLEMYYKEAFTLISIYFYFYSNIYYVYMVTAGASIILTNSYQASVPGFMEHLGLSEESSEALIELSATLARRAIEEHLAAAAEGKFLSLSLKLNLQTNPLMNDFYFRVETIPKIILLTNTDIIKIIYYGMSYNNVKINLKKTNQSRAMAILN
jgi:hypothetical protein